MARASVWITVASVLAAFDIAPARDAEGNLIPVEEKYTSGFITWVFIFVFFRQDC
jgi:hypothetical protein